MPYTNPVWNPKGRQKGIFGRGEYFSPSFSSQHLENLPGHTCGILLGNTRIHIQMLSLNLLIPGTGTFPNPFVRNCRKEAAQWFSTGYADTVWGTRSQLLKNWISNHCQKEPGAQSHCPTERRPIKCADSESSKENTSFVSPLSTPVDSQTCTNLLMLLMQCPELSLRKNEKRGRGNLFRLWRFGQELLLQRTI